MKTHVLTLTMLGCVVVLGGTAGANPVPFSYSGPGVTVSGSLFGVDNTDGTRTITGIAATYNQIPVTRIVSPNSDPYFLYNNLYYLPQSALLAVDDDGIVFHVPGLGDVNLCTYSAAGGCGLGGYASILWDGYGYQFTQVSQSHFGPETPEPATLALFGSGLVAAVVAARRRLRYQIISPRPEELAVTTASHQGAAWLPARLLLLFCPLPRLTIQWCVALHFTVLGNVASSCH